MTVHSPAQPVTGAQSNGAAKLSEKLGGSYRLDLAHTFCVMASRMAMLPALSPACSASTPGWSRDTTCSDSVSLSSLSFLSCKFQQLCAAELLGLRLVQGCKQPIPSLC